MPVRHVSTGRPHGREQPDVTGNYEPNSWDRHRQPGEDPEGGFHSFPDDNVGAKRRVRSERFADHYSQARQFLLSQTSVEAEHIRAAFVFELSKVERPDIRARMVANLRNVDEDFAQGVADGLGLTEMPPASEPAKAPIDGLPESPALSIVRNGRAPSRVASSACC